MAQRIEMEQFGGDGRTGGASPQREERTIGELIRELGDDSTRLFQEEVNLARAEMREKIEVYERNLVTMVVGGVLVLGAVLVLLVAVNRGLTVLLNQFMSLEVAVWVAPLILATLAGLVGWSMVRKAQRAMAREGVTPTRTMESLRDEGRWMKDRAQEMRDDMRETDAGRSGSGVADRSTRSAHDPPRERRSPSDARASSGAHVRHEHGHEPRTEEERRLARAELRDRDPDGEVRHG